MEQPNEIEVGNLVIEKLKHDEYWSNPKNRKTRIVVELMLREMYYMGFNNAIQQAQTPLDLEPKKDCPDGQHEVKQGELKCANCGTPYLHGQK